MSIQLYERIAKDVEAIVDDLRKSWSMWHFYEGIMDVHNGNLAHLNGVEGSSGFFTMIRKMYAHSICLAVRRQVKSSRDSISLIGVLDDMKANQLSQKFLSKENFRLWWDHKQRDAEYFDSAYEILVGGHQDIAYAIQGDIEKVKAAARPIETFVDRMVAHLDRRSPQLPCFDDIDDALEALSEVALKLHNRIGGDPSHDIRPTFLFHAAAPLLHRLDARTL